MNRKILLVLFVISSDGATSDIQIISRDTAVLDKEIPEFVRNEFSDDDGRPMKSISINLDNDENPEKLIPNEFLCGNGGCPWLVYSPSLNKVIGHLDGKIIVILDATSDGYKSIETQWSLGCCRSETATYRFHNDAYQKEK